MHRFGRARIAKQDGGPLLYGGNLQDWPARDYDALVVINGVDNSIENADHKANPI